MSEASGLCLPPSMCWSGLRSGLQWRRGVCTLCCWCNEEQDPLPLDFGIACLWSMALLGGGGSACMALAQSLMHAAMHAAKHAAIHAARHAVVRTSMHPRSNAHSHAC
eukprot:1140939-Pelagomonas_calceolata.AAC.7